MELDIYDLADEFAQQTSRCIFLTGKAGSGKTTFLRRLRKMTNKQVAVAAPTGVAAINAGGVTLNSMFQIPPEIFLPTTTHEKSLIANQHMRKERRRVLYDLEVLVIDEISMVRADMLDAVDAVLRHYRYSQEPFGGVQVILIGDLFQLSPVVRDADLPLLREFYAGPYFFQSHVMQRLQPVYIELDKIFRQQNMDFVRILNEVRNNCLTPENQKLLNSRYQPDFQPRKDDFFITLTTHNAKADQINERALEELKGSFGCYDAKVQGDFPENNYPTDAELLLKVGARVMFVKNDESRDKLFYNGKLATVTELNDDTVTVVDEKGLEIEVGPQKWNNVRYTLDTKTKQLKEEILGTFAQLPLRLAWAITIHKSQGLTFDRCVIDVGGAFAAGQVYVALSRCRSLEGIVLLSPVTTSGLINAQEVLQHERQKLPMEELMKLIQPAKREFRLQVLASVFDFHILVGQAQRLMEYIKQHADEFERDSASVDYLRNLVAMLVGLSEIGGRFRPELKRLIEGGEETQLRQRMQDAYGYFEPRFMQVLEDLKKSPLTTSVRKTSDEVDEVVQSVGLTLQQHLQLMKAVTDDPTVEVYYRTKRHFRGEKIETTSYAGRKITEATGEFDQVLYKRLQAWRNRRAEGKRVFLVANNEALQMVARALPRNGAELMKLKGWGKVKVQQYGEEVLEIVQDYLLD